MPEQQKSAEQKAQFAAYVGIDWADREHVWSLQVAVTGKREHGDVGPTVQPLGLLVLSVIVRKRPRSGSTD